MALLRTSKSSDLHRRLSLLKDETTGYFLILTQVGFCVYVVCVCVCVCVCVFYVNEYVCVCVFVHKYMFVRAHVCM